MHRMQTYFGIALVAFMAPLVGAQETPEPEAQASDEPVEETRGVAVEEEGAESPLSLDVTYYLYSDYIFRGINFSEYPGEGREKPNHQLTTSIGLDLGLLVGQESGRYGTFVFDTFFEWYADQRVLNPESNNSLQEIDYALGWSYDVEPLASTVSLGYLFYVFPNAKPLNTQEWTVGLEHNDAWMWQWLWPDNENGVLNPTLFYAQDVDEIKGGWAEIGISHGFEVLECLTITPSVLAGIDHRYLGPATGTSVNGSMRLAYMQYGLSADFDLSTIGRIPKDPGTWTLSGFLYFSDAMGRLEREGALHDEFYGGVSIGWSF